MDAIDPDAFGSHFGRHVARQRLEGQLRRRVMRAARQHFRGLNRSDVTMLPGRRSGIARRQYTCEQSHAARKLTSTSRVHWSSLSSRNGTMVSIPALFTRMSMGPRSFHVRSIIGSTSARLATSACTDIARRPARRIPSATCFGVVHVADVVHGDVRAFISQDLRNATANAAAGACHQRNFAFQSHTRCSIEMACQVPAADDD